MLKTVLTAGFAAIALLALPACVDAAVDDKGPGTQANNPDNPDDPDDPPPPAPFVPADARLRRLASWQMTNAVRDLLGADAAAVVTPPADIPLNGFGSVGAGTLSLSPVDVELIEQSAFAAAQVAVAAGAQPWRVCAPTAFDDRSCMEQIVSNLGRKAWRRPLSTDEVTRWSDVGTAAASAYGDFDLGLEFVVAGLFQSPHFIYQVEVGVPVEGDATARRLDGYEIASRLSFFLLGTTPSDGLLDAAGRGDLDDATGVGLYAEALLADPRARTALEMFFDERFQLTQMLAQNRNDPAYTDAIQGFMREETLRFIGDVVWDNNADAREIFAADFTYLNDPLAAFYGLPLPGTGDAFARVTLDASSKRGGILTQGAFLSRFAHLNRSSPTLRGKFVREALMCQSIGAPPDDVDTTLPEPTGTDMPRTTRDRLSQHVENPSCASCHVGMDPIGFALEGFDQAGRARTHENGLPIDDASDLDGTPVVGARALSAALKESQVVPHCLVRNVFRQGVGHIEEAGEDPSLALVEDRFEDAGYRLRDLLYAVVVSDAFRLVRLPGGAP